MDQQIIDLLYNAVYVQHLRYSHYNSMQLQGQWNSRFHDETIILNTFVEKYKKYFITRCQELSKLITETKQYNTESYLTINTEFYLTQYEEHITELKKYTDKVNAINVHDILTTDLSSLGSILDKLYPDFIKTATLFGNVN